MLIAEIGNNHFGSIDKAQRLIEQCVYHGADLIKSQAFLAKDVKTGSMPESFYKKCEFTLDQYIYLMDYAQLYGIHLFYSIFSSELEPLLYHQLWNKVAGGQLKMHGSKFAEERDAKMTFVSIPDECDLPRLRKAKVMYVGPYLSEKPNLEMINLMRSHYKKKIGYSDHSMGISRCLNAIEYYGANVIEKHVVLTEDKEYSYQGKLYRDCLHACIPSDLREIKKKLNIRGRMAG